VTLGGSFDAILLFARTEARVMRGIVNGGVISIYSPDGKLSTARRVSHRAEAASRTRAKQKLISMAKFVRYREILFSLSSMSYRQSLESRDVDFNGCLGPLRTSCVLTTASERSGNRCSTSPTFIRRLEDSARKNDLLQPPLPETNFSGQCLDHLGHKPWRKLYPCVINLLY
jgi:hypothetical protein